MLPNMLLRPFGHDSSSLLILGDIQCTSCGLIEPKSSINATTNCKGSEQSEDGRKGGSWINVEPTQNDLHFVYPVMVPCNIDPVSKQAAKFSLRSQPDAFFDNRKGSRGGGGIKKMANKVSNFSDLIQRVTASCLLNPLTSSRRQFDDISINQAGEDESSGSGEDNCQMEEDIGIDDEKNEKRENGFGHGGVCGEEKTSERLIEMEMLMGETFEAVSTMKRAYVSLQQAHCPWDPHKMRVADVAVVAELRRLAVLKQRFRRSIGRRECEGGRGMWRVGAATLGEVVAPYEAAVEELKREMKAKEVEIHNLKEKLKTTSAAAVSGGSGSGGKKGRSHQSKKKVSSKQGQVAPAPGPAPAPELFEATMSSVKEASKSFTALLLSLMRSANWDIAAAVRSIEAASSTTNPTAPADSVVGANHAKYALESYVNRKVFQGFDHETFYMDGSLSSLLHPDQYRRDCFTQYSDMKAMDPIELLGILPSCSFGKFCSKKYLAIVHPKMEESLLGDLEQRRQVLAGNHPRSQFYGEFLGLAKAVWLLHLLAFSLDPPPSHFEASKVAEYHPQYMESVVKFPKGRVGLGVGLIVGFPVSPGFKLGNGSVIKARVYLAPKNGF